jgi:hypothetical protein
MALTADRYRQYISCCIHNGTFSCRAEERMTDANFSKKEKSNVVSIIVKG